MNKKKIGVSISLVSLMALGLATANKDTLANVLKDTSDNYVEKISTYSDKDINRFIENKESSNKAKIENLELVNIALKNTNKYEVKQVEDENPVEPINELALNNIEENSTVLNDTALNNTTKNKEEIDNSEKQDNITNNDESSLSNTVVEEVVIEELPKVEEVVNNSEESTGTTEESVTLSEDELSPQIDLNDIKVIELPIQGWVTNNLNVRSNPKIDNNIIGVLNLGAKIDGVESNGWVKVDYNGKVAYISREYISLTEVKIPVEEKVEEKVEDNTTQNNTTQSESPKGSQISGWIKNAVNFRTKPSTGSDSTVISVLAVGTKISGVESNGWVKITYEGKEGYVARSYISTTEISNNTSNDSSSNKNESSNNSSNNAVSSDKINKIVNDAYSYVGSKYTWAGSTPSSGFDCSGLVYYLYKTHAGITLNRNSAAQASNGYKVSFNSLKPGDLLFFSHSGSTINHVGLYVGNGKMVHASNPEQGVRVDTVTSGYYANTFVTARRIID